MFFRRIIFALVIMTLPACGVVKGTAKVTGAVVYHTGNAVYKTGKATVWGVRTVVYMAKGKQIIPLEKSGSSLYATVYLGRKKIPAKLMIDTGASATQITAAMAKRLGLNLNKAPRITAKMANGQAVYAREVEISRIQLGRVRVANVRALVLEQQIPAHGDGLLGMSFLDHFVFQIDADKPELVLQQKAK